MSRLKENLEKYLALRRMSPAELAKITGINSSYLYKILRGERDAEALGYLKLRDLAKGLKISIYQLTGDPADKMLELLLQKATDTDLAIFESIVDLPPEHHRRQTIIDILGIEEPKKPKKARKTTVRKS